MLFAVAGFNQTEPILQIGYDFVRQGVVFPFFIADEVVHGGIVNEFRFQGMDTLFEPRLQTTAVVKDVWVFTVFGYPFPN